MARIFECRMCRYRQAVKWTGLPCPSCYLFANIKDVNSVDDEEGNPAELIEGVPISLQDAIDAADKAQAAGDTTFDRIESGIVGFDRVLGGGIVPGSLTLVCGDPGAGKSTILVQVAQAIARRRESCLYVCGEETVEQMAYRYRSFGKFPARMQAIHVEDIDDILDHVDEVDPRVVIIDSIQCVQVDEALEVGSAASIKTAIKEFMKCAKAKKIAFFIIGHLTKGGAIGGPRALEYLVDVSLYLSGNKFDPRRVLHCYAKNRFGKAPTLSTFEMSEDGSGLIDKWKEEEEREAAERAQEEADTAEALEHTRAEALRRLEAKERLQALKPALRSIPGGTSGAGKGNPAASWIAPDGTQAAIVLAVSCDDCRATIDRACTADDGTREAGFHQSRVWKSTRRIVIDAAPEIEKPEPAAPALLAEKPFGAPPKVATKKKPGKKPKNVSRSATTR